MNFFTWIIVAMFAAFLVFGTGCYPTHSDVQDFARMEAERDTKNFDALGDLMTKQHSVQTPAAASEMDALKQQNAQLMAALLGEGTKAIDEHKPQYDFSQLAALVVASGGISGVLGGLWGGKKAKEGPSRAQPSVDKVQTQLASVLGVLNQVVATINAQRPGSVAPPAPIL